ncbi:MAG: hypothetical protein ACREF7_03675 [Candidatus Saccharimonadales bacterium]
MAVFGLIYLYSQPALADSGSSSGNIEIVAYVKPVRDVLINAQGRISEIQSNTSSNVAPSVYRDSYNTKPIKLSPNIYSQYTTILAHLNLNKTGVIYKQSDSKAGLAFLKLKPVISVLLKISF